MFWSTQSIEREQKLHPLIEVKKFDSKRVKQGAYELSLGRKVLITSDGVATDSFSTDTSAIRIPPGQFALLYTDESVSIPDNVIAFISLKGKVKFKGLVNVSGFHVDPGFQGYLKFSVYNASNEDVHLNFGEACFLIWFAKFDEPVRDPYKGVHYAQAGFTTEDRERMSEPHRSPEALSQRLEATERNVSVIIAVGAVVIIPLIVGLVIVIFERWFGEKADKLGTGGAIVMTALIVGIAVLLLSSFLNGSFMKFVRRSEQQKRD